MHCILMQVHWMNTKNTFHIISLERKMIIMGFWCDIRSLPNRPHPLPHPKPRPHVFRCHACLDFRRVLPICRKSGLVSATLTNELQHMLLWMVGRRIGSAIIRSRKTNIVCVRVYFGDDFRRFWETLAQTIILRPRKLLRAMILTWIQEEKWEQLLLQISHSASTLCGYEATSVL